MKRILVTTDFSKNSESAMRFAIQWAKMEDVELKFIYVMQLGRQQDWTDEDYQKYEEKETLIFEEKLNEMVKRVMAEVDSYPAHYNCITIPGISVDSAILDYCHNAKDVDYICISTRGAGGMQKLLGTNTGNLITNAEIPVIALPSDYEGGNFSTVMYASDLNNYDEEVQKVMDFAKPFRAKIEVLHFYWPNEKAADEKARNEIYNRDYEYGFYLHFLPHEVSNALSTNIQAQIEERQPSMVAMFTNKTKGFWEKLISPSKTEKISFETKVPLLVFRK